MHKRNCKNQHPFRKDNTWKSTRNSLGWCFFIKKRNKNLSRWYQLKRQASPPDSRILLSSHISWIISNHFKEIMFSLQMSMCPLLIMGIYNFIQFLSDISCISLERLPTGSNTCSLIILKYSLISFDRSLSSLMCRTALFCLFLCSNTWPLVLVLILS